MVLGIGRGSRREFWTEFCPALAAGGKGGWFDCICRFQRRRIGERGNLRFLDDRIDV